MIRPICLHFGDNLLTATDSRWQIGKGVRRWSNIIQRLPNFLFINDIIDKKKKAFGRNYLSTAVNNS